MSEMNWRNGGQCVYGKGEWVVVVTFCFHSLVDFGGGRALRKSLVKEAMSGGL